MHLNTLKAIVVYKKLTKKEKEVEKLDKLLSQLVCKIPNQDIRAYNEATEQIDFANEN